MSSDAATQPTHYNFLEGVTSQTNPSGSVVNTFITRSAQFSLPNLSLGVGVQPALYTPISETLEELESLFANKNVGDFIFKPTSYAYNNARSWLLDASQIMGDAFIKPSLISDGEGGIDIEWETDNKIVIASCRGKASQKDYIYFESRDRGEGRPRLSYGGEDLTLRYLKDRLTWLIHE